MTSGLGFVDDISDDAQWVDALLGLSRTLEHWRCMRAELQCGKTDDPVTPTNDAFVLCLLGVAALEPMLTGVLGGWAVFGGGLASPPIDADTVRGARLLR